VLTAFYTWLNVRIQKKTDEKIDKLQKSIISLGLDAIDIRKGVTNLFEDMVTTLVNMRRILLVLDLLRLGTSPSVNKTTADILRTDKVMSPREASILLLKNLTLEYGEHISILKEKVGTAEEGDDKERLTKILEEFKSMATLLSTISEESSDGYIEHIFNEVVLGVTKIRNT
jgi:hypothetical protein